jgi:hypothetical protein
MGLFTGAAPPDVTKTQTTASTTPDYYTDYLTKLSQTGQNAMGTYDPITKQFTAPTQATMVAAGSPYVAELTQEQKDIFSGAPTQLTRYQTPLDDALTAGQAGMSVDQADISKYYNPYENAVVGGLGAQSATNVQRNLMPQMKAGFVGTGGLGSSRYANAMGQTMGDVNTALLQEQNKTRMAGYNTALDAAMKEAQLMKGYTVPTNQTQTYKGPGDVYQPSPLSQIASLGTLLASGFNANSTGWGNQLLKGLGTFGSSPDADKVINEYFKASGNSPFDVSDIAGQGYTEELPEWLQEYYANNPG